MRKDLESVLHTRGKWLSQYAIWTGRESQQLSKTVKSLTAADSRLHANILGMCEKAKKGIFEELVTLDIGMHGWNKFTRVWNSINLLRNGLAEA